MPRAQKPRLVSPRAKKKSTALAPTSERRTLDRVRPEGEHYVLIALPSGEERLEPLVDLSPHGVAVLLRVQRSDITPGTFLPRVRFFTNGECTLQCQATVREVSEAEIESGGLGMKLGLKLEIHEPSAATAPTVDTYSEPTIIGDAVANLFRAKATVRVERGSDPKAMPRAVCHQLHRERRQLVLRLEGAKDGVFPQGEAYELATELYGTRLSLVATLTAKEGDLLRFAWPTQLSVWRHRASGRVRKLPRPVEIEFESPFGQDRRVREVVDLSARGVAFSGELDDGLLVGMLVQTVTIRLPDTTVRGRGVVRNVRQTDDKLLIGLELVGMSDNNLRALEGFVDSNLHPQVRPAVVSDLRRVWPLYEELGLFERQHAAISPAIGRIENVRSTLLTRGRELLLHLVAGADDKVFGNAELLHTYSSTWSLQHTGVQLDAPVTPEQLVGPLIEAALRRSDFQHMHAILDPEKSRVALARLQTSDVDPKHIAWSERTLVAEVTERAVPNDLAEAQDAGPGDLQWLVEQLRTRTDELTRAVFDLTGAELRLDRVNRLYHHSGLERSRRVRIAFSVSGPVGFSLLESTTPGVCLPGHADLARLYTTRRDESARRDALGLLARDAVRLARASGRKRTLFLVEPEDAERLAAHGFVVVGRRLELVASRTGATQVAAFSSLMS